MAADNQSYTISRSRYAGIPLEYLLSRIYVFPLKSPGGNLRAVRMPFDFHGT
jgi:hypothetical protein